MMTWESSHLQAAIVNPHFGRLRHIYTDCHSEACFNISSPAPLVICSLAVSQCDAVCCYDYKNSLMYVWTCSFDRPIPQSALERLVDSLLVRIDR